MAAEDTRVGGSLLSHFDIRKPLVSYYEHNKRERGEIITARILSGESCALITDAGTPAVSDPGEDLAALCVEKGIKVSPIPGVSALITALSASGMPSGRFCFEGFLSVNKKSRREHLASLQDESRTMIFYEAPHKLRTTLDDLYTAFGDRRIVMARELTKLHEECLRMTLPEAAAYYGEHEPRGEFVLVIEGASENPEQAAANQMEQAIALTEELTAAGLTLRDAVKQAAKQTGARKNQLYQIMLAREKGE